MSTTEAAPKKLAGRTYSATKEQAAASRAWFVVDATDKPLGRLASEVARVLRGKHKPTYTPHQDTGDFVIVVNAGKVKHGQQARQEVLLPPLGHPGRLPRRGLPRSARSQA
jgi:large subunit ribosomal protein L13